MNPRVLILYNQPAENGPLATAWQASDSGVLNAVRNVSGALDALGWPGRTAGVHRLSDLPPVLAAGSEDVVFNLVEHLDGEDGDAHAVPAVCRALGRACTGGTPACLALTLDKELTKARLRQHGVTVPAGVVVPVGGAIPATLPPGVLFVKPLASDGSEGIDAAMSVIHDKRRQLAAAVAQVHRTCGQPALIEAFIEGRELNLAVMERGTEVVPLPPSEIDFTKFPPGLPHVVDYRVKWQPGTLGGCVSPRRVPADLDEALRLRLAELARCAWHACECRDYGRVDCRLDASGTIYVLEVNVNCDLSPLAGLPAALTAAGISFPEFVRQMVENASKRSAECGARSAE
jgi:D-alanine-D-alanine ligase